MLERCNLYLDKLCREFFPRPVGSPGNSLANLYFREVVESFGWEVEATSFSALDWEAIGAELTVDSQQFTVIPSPYSQGCDLQTRLSAAATLDELRSVDAAGSVLLLHSELAREQLMPKNFVFFNPEEHKQIISLLEQKSPAGIICATGRNSALAGGEYPFPLIEDGDFLIPSVYLTEEDGRELLGVVGREVKLVSKTDLKTAPSESLAASKGNPSSQKITISAHIDAKINTPGAIDNATGVIVLLLLAEMLESYQGETRIELLPFNGEDYYSPAGQMLYLEQNQDSLDQILLNINIDGAGYYQGPSAFSAFNLPVYLNSSLEEILDGSNQLEAGSPWYQGDHSIFIQQGIPALAVTSAWFLENMENQSITHTPADHPGIVDRARLPEIAAAILKLIKTAGLKAEAAHE